MSGGQARGDGPDAGTGSADDAVDRARLAAVIGASARPATVESLTEDLERLGVTPGITLMVHSSLSRLGFVAGGAQAVVEALLAVLGPSGTLMMPTHASHLGDPARWERPPVPPEWWETIRACTPAFDPELTPTFEMGAIVECFRHMPGVRRSAHPRHSAAAFGPHAQQLVDGHGLDDGLGEGSPQARLYDLDGHVLLLGVTHGNNTSLHLAEHRIAPVDAPVVIESSSVRTEAGRAWVTYRELATDSDDFDAIGAAFAATGGERRGPVGAGVGRLMRARDVVDFATARMREHRGPGRAPG